MKMKLYTAICTVATAIALPTFSQNYFAGYQAGASNTTGSHNAFVGYQAGTDNTTGSENAFFGTFSGGWNTTGTANTFVGYSSGSELTTGSYNVFVGNNTGFGNNGNNNTFVGAGTGSFSYSGDNNSFFGNGIGWYNYGQNNSIFGASAGANNLGGSFNTYMGAQSGINAKSASSNTFLGYRSGYKTTSGGSNTFIGRESGYNATSAINNNFMGYQSGYGTTTGGNNLFIGYSAGSLNTTGSYNLALGNFAGPASGALTNAIAIGARSRVNISNAIVLGAISGINGATANTRVGIRTTSPAYSFHVNASDAAKVGGGSWVVASDKRLKKDISEFTDGAEMLANIKPVWFSYNGKAGITTNKKFVGVIAQEVQEVAPYMVGDFEYVDENGSREKYLDYDPNALTYVLVNTVKQQQRRIDSLESEILEIKRMLMNGGAGAVSGGKLWQNQPNPTAGSTTITYFVPDDSRTALLNIYAMSGQLIRSVNISSRGKGTYNLSLKQYAAGTYSYQLVVDGKIADHKKMILSK